MYTKKIILWKISFYVFSKTKIQMYEHLFIYFIKPKNYSIVLSGIKPFVFQIVLLLKYIQTFN